MRLVLFGDGAWATGTLEALLPSGHTVAGLVTRVTPSDLKLAQCAALQSIPILAPSRCSAPDVLRWVTGLQPDLLVSISYDQIIRRPLLDAAPRGFINFHAGALPRYRGRNVINWAIINGDSSIGLTAHYVDEGIDTGDILRQITFPVAWTDTYGDVLTKIVSAFPEFVLDTIRELDEGRATRMQQPVLGTYFARRRPGDEWLDWRDSSLNLYNKIRGITRPGPGARTFVEGQEAIVWRAAYDPEWPRYLATPGEVVGRAHDGVVVKTGDSTLLITECSVSAGASFVPVWRIGTRMGSRVDYELTDLQRRVDILLDRTNTEAGEG